MEVTPTYVNKDLEATFRLRPRQRLRVFQATSGWQMILPFQFLSEQSDQAVQEFVDQQQTFTVPGM